MVFESFDPRVDIRNSITTLVDLNLDGTNNYVITITDSSNNIHYIPVYLSEETKSDVLPSLPYVEFGLVYEKSEPQDIGAETRKSEAYIDMNVYYQYDDNVNQITMGELIAKELYVKIRSLQTQLMPGKQSFVNFTSSSFIPVETKSRQVVYHMVIELYALWYN